MREEVQPRHGGTKALLIDDTSTFASGPVRGPLGPSLQTLPLDDEQAPAVARSALLPLLHFVESSSETLTARIPAGQHAAGERLLLLLTPPRRGAPG